MSEINQALQNRLSEKVQFAVVREDYLVELEIIDNFHLNNVLLIASGGCTALNLKLLRPTLNIDLFDINPCQLQLVQKKVDCLNNDNVEKRKVYFNVGNDNSQGYNAGGNFEGLFRCFRDFVKEFILDTVELTHLLTFNDNKADSYLLKLMTSKYWDTAFQIYFSDVLLITLFGPDAIRYAEPKSYPNYFKAKIEAGLKREDRITNYFLHHFFLGYYIDNQAAQPPYCLFEGKMESFKMYEMALNKINNLRYYDMIGLSNIFDWSSESQIKETFVTLCENLNPGSIVLYRQLNNNNNYQKFYDSHFVLNTDLGQNLICKDRSLFYEKINILEKVR